MTFRFVYRMNLLIRRLTARHRASPTATQKTEYVFANPPFDDGSKS